MGKFVEELAVISDQINVISTVGVFSVEQFGRIALGLPKKENGSRVFETPRLLARQLKLVNLGTKEIETNERLANIKINCR